MCFFCGDLSHLVTTVLLHELLELGLRVLVLSLQRLDLLLQTHLVTTVLLHELLELGLCVLVLSLQRLDLLLQTRTLAL